MALKECKACLLSKDRSEFYLKSTGRGKPRAITSRCKVCFNGADKDRVAWKDRLKRYVVRSAEVGVQCNLDVAYIRQAYAASCAYCGRAGRPMSLDRKVPSLGYVRSNVAPSCRTCNQIKGDLSWAAWEHILPSVRSAAAAGLLP